MSRGGKAGLDYFPVDVDIFEDEKIELVSAKYGLISELIVIKLLTRIYRNGYFMKWGNDIAYLFAKKFGDGITKELLDNVVTELINKTFFNEQSYIKYSILTSRGIQRVYIEATKRRKSIDIYKEFLLLKKIDVDILNQNVNILGLNVDIYKQSKVKESKKKVKEREKESNKDILSGKPDDIPYKEIVDHLNVRINSKYDHITEKTRSLIRSLWGKYKLNDFKYVIDIKSQEWEDTEQEKYLRPKTLFKKDNFESYRNQKREISQEKKDEKIKQECVEEYYKKHPEERDKI